MITEAEVEAAAMRTPLGENDLYYLRSIKRQLDLVHESLSDDVSFSLAGIAFADTRDWLDCFIDEHERKRAAITAAAQARPSLAMSNPAKDKLLALHAELLPETVERKSCVVLTIGKAIEIVEALLDGAIAIEQAKQALDTPGQVGDWQFTIGPREGGHYFISSRDLPGFSMMLVPTDDLAAALTAFLNAEAAASPPPAQSGDGQAHKFNEFVERLSELAMQALRSMDQGHHCKIGVTPVVADDLRAASVTIPLFSARIATLTQELAEARAELFNLRNRAGCGPDQEGMDIWQQLAAADKVIEPFVELLALAQNGDALNGNVTVLKQAFPAKYVDAARAYLESRRPVAAGEERE